MKKYTRDYFTRDRIRIGVWDYLAPLSNRKSMEQLRDMGVDMILHGSATTDPEVRERTLTLADELGIEVIVDDLYIGDGGSGRRWSDEEIEAFDFKAMVAPYEHHPCFSGNHIIDEHGLRDFDWVAKIANKYEKDTGKLGYINLLPKYANAKQLTGGASQDEIEIFESDSKLFDHYNDEYCRLYNMSYISTDVYPLKIRDGKMYTYRDYAEALNQVARSGKKHGKDFWCCVQAFSWKHETVRNPIEGECRWQCYCVLSFGCKCIGLYSYAGAEGYTQCPAVVDQISWEPTERYYYWKPVLWEIRNISDAYVQYRHLGAFGVNASDDVPYLKMTEEYKVFTAISDLRTKDPLLFGCFAHKSEAAHAFTVVNMHDFSKPAKATLQFAAEGRVISHQGGKALELTPENGVYTITLEQGEGAFVEVLQK